MYSGYGQIKNQKPKKKQKPKKHGMSHLYPHGSGLLHLAFHTVQAKSLWLYKTLYSDHYELTLVI